MSDCAGPMVIEVASPVVGEDVSPALRLAPPPPPESLLPPTREEILGADLSAGELSTDPAERTPPRAKNLQALLDAILKKFDVEPAEELIKLAVERDEQGQFMLCPSERIRVWSELLMYRMPKLKSVEMRGEVDHRITVVVRKFGGDTVLERPAQGPPEVPVTVTKKF